MKRNMNNDEKPNCLDGSKNVSKAGPRFQILDHGSKEKNCPSYERLISNYNFDEVPSEHETSRECDNEKSRSVCGKHSSTTGSTSRSSKQIRVAAASVSSDRGKAIHSNQSCSCSEKRKNQALNHPITMTSNHTKCQGCKAKQNSIMSICKESMLTQVWTYLQKLNTAHKVSCQSCRSNSSKTCKVPLIEQARVYLMSLFYDHQTGCQRCKQKDMTSYLETILQQAWSYFQQARSVQKVSTPPTSESDNFCYKRCLQMSQPNCCKRSTGTDVSGCSPNCKPKAKPIGPTSDNTPPPGILKYPSRAKCSPSCSCSEYLQEEKAKKPANRADVVFPKNKSSSKAVEKKLSQECIKPELCKSKKDEKEKQPADCKRSSEDNQQELNESPNGSCCSFQAIVASRKPSACSGGCTMISQVPQDSPCEKKSSPTQPYQQEQGHEDDSNDHQICEKPMDCQHSKEASPSGSANSCLSQKCTGACQSKEEQKAVPVQKVKSPCEGGASKASPPAFGKQCTVDDGYEAFLDKQFGRTVPKQLHDKETICRDGCDCMTCIEAYKPAKPTSSEHKADPHKYRFYY